MVYLTTLLLPSPLTSLTPRCQRRRGGCRRWRLLVTNHPPPSSLAAPPPPSLLSKSRVCLKPLLTSLSVLSLCRVRMCVCVCVCVCVSYDTTRAASSVPFSVKPSLSGCRREDWSTTQRLLQPFGAWLMLARAARQDWDSLLCNSPWCVSDVDKSFETSLGQPLL